VAFYRIYLTEDERQQLKTLISTGKRSAAHIRDAHILLASDFGRDSYLSETKIAERLHLSIRTVERTRKAFFENGMGVFDPKPRSGRSDKKIDGRLEAQLIAISCSEPPAGQSRWTLQAIADRAIELQFVDSISAVAVGTTLKKMRSNPGVK
jgi:transposase